MGVARPASFRRASPPATPSFRPRHSMKLSSAIPPRRSSASARSRSSPGSARPSSGSPSWKASRSWSSPRAPSGRARPPCSKITTRNIETLHFTAYKLNAESYFRKKNGLEKVESLDIGLVAPDAAWTAPVPGYARYKPSEAKFELKKLELPGVYVVKVTDEKTLQATTLVLGSDLDAIVKTSRDQILVFAQDMKTGKGRAGRSGAGLGRRPDRARRRDRRRRRSAARLESAPGLATAG